MTWNFDRQTGSVTDENGNVVADCLPEHGALIEAAPELLAACERAEREFTSIDSDDYDDILAQLRDAISKARGER